MTFSYAGELFAVQAFPVDGKWVWAYWLSGLDYYRASGTQFATNESAVAEGKRQAELHIHMSPR